MNNDLIEDIPHVELDTTPTVTYNFDRSANRFAQILKQAYISDDGFFEKEACQAIENVSESILKHPDGLFLFDSEKGLTNLMRVVHEHPTVVETLESDGLMDIFGKFMSRTDLNKPNGEFNPMSIVNCANEDFNLDIFKGLPAFLPKEMVLGFLKTL